MTRHLGMKQPYRTPLAWAALLVVVVLALIAVMSHDGKEIDSSGPEREAGVTDVAADDESEQLVLVGIGAGDANGQDDFDLATMEDQLIEIIDGGRLGEVDGTGTDLETGESEIYVYGPSADAILQAIRPVLEQWSGDGLIVDAKIRRGPIGADTETVSIS